MKRVLLAAMALALLGCWSTTEPEGPRVYISMQVSQTVTVPVRMQVVIGDNDFHFDAARLIIWNASSTGTLPVAIQLLSESGDTLATWNGTHDFDPGREHWIEGQVGSPRPVGICLGDLTAVPIAAPVSDTLFIMQGSAPSGVVC